MTYIDVDCYERGCACTSSSRVAGEDYEVVEVVKMKEETLKSLKDLHELQGADGNWNHDPYMHGMYNGMELMLSVLEGRNPEFKEAPTEWVGMK